MSRGVAEWLANATVDDLIWVTFLLAAGIGAVIGIAVWNFRHRGES